MNVRQRDLDLYFLIRLDKKLGHPKINEPRIRKYARKAGVSEDIINYYLKHRESGFPGLKIPREYTRVIDEVFKINNIYTSLKRVPKHLIEKRVLINTCKFHSKIKDPYERNELILKDILNQHFEKIKYLDIVFINNGENDLDEILQKDVSYFNNNLMRIILKNEEKINMAKNYLKNKVHKIESAKAIFKTSGKNLTLNLNKERYHVY